VFVFVCDSESQRERTSNSLTISPRNMRNAQITAVPPATARVYRTVSGKAQRMDVYAFVVHKRSGVSVRCRVGWLLLT
jgi:hypothetical protein